MLDVIVTAYLNICGKPAKYFTQKERRFLVKKEYAGKGTPKQLKRLTILGQSAGIDCSGLVANIINFQKPIRSVLMSPSKNVLKILRFLLRPIENTNVSLLVNKINSLPLGKTTDIKPMDLINVGEKHVMLVTKVTRKTIYYVNSSEYKGKVGIETITKSDDYRSLASQTWSDSKRQNMFASTAGSGVRRLIRF